MSNRIGRGGKRRPEIVCGMPVRKNLDLEVMAFLKAIDPAFHNMRAELGMLPGEDDIEGAAVKQYLIYLRVLVDVALAGLVMNAVHGNDLLIVMVQRLLVEYATKATYYREHPRFAVYMLCVNEPASAAQRAKDRGDEPEVIAQCETIAAEMRTKYAAYANTAGVPVREMMESMGRTEEWASLYGMPSLLLHGEPEGMRMIYDFDESGQRPRIDLDDPYVNALLVDAGANVLTFCRAFNAAFHDEDQKIANRFADLEERARLLILKHPYGRSEDALVDFRAGGSD